MSQSDVLEVLKGGPGVWFSVNDVMGLTGDNIRIVTSSLCNCWKWYRVDRGVGGLVVRKRFLRDDHMFVFLYCWVPD